MKRISQRVDEQVCLQRAYRIAERGVGCECGVTRYAVRAKGGKGGERS